MLNLKEKQKFQKKGFLKEESYPANFPKLLIVYLDVERKLGHKMSEAQKDKFLFSNFFFFFV
jgi:hypothetical protein